MAPLDLIILTIMLAVLLVPLLVPWGKWLWISIAGISIFLAYENVQSYLFRANMENKYGPGQMLGDMLLYILTGAFLLGVGLRLVVWAARKLWRRLAVSRKAG